MDNFKDIANRPYTKWLEDSLRELYANEPDKICIAFNTKDNLTFTAYYKCESTDKAVFAHHIYSDAIFDMVLNNAKLVKEAIDSLEDEEAE